MTIAAGLNVLLFKHQVHAPILEKANFLGLAGTVSAMLAANAANGHPTKSSEAVRTACSSTTLVMYVFAFIRERPRKAQMSLLIVISVC